MIEVMNKRDLIRTIETLLDGNEAEQAGRLLSSLNFHMVAKIINDLPDHRQRIFILLPPEVQAEASLILSLHSRQEIFAQMSDEAIARFLQYNDEDDAVDVLQQLPPQRHDKILNKIKADKQAKIEHLFRFAPETAGGLMDLNFIIVKPTYTFRDVAEKVQKHFEKEGRMPFILITDERGKLLGHLPYKKLITSRPSVPITDLIRPLPAVPFHTDQEDVMYLAEDETSDIIGVTDDSGLVLGVVHVRDLLEIAETEATEDVYSFAGVHRDEEISDPALDKVRRRWVWLIVNLGTAVLASFVVSRFEDSITKISLLAVFMPMVAGEGGNAATQALAVVVRGLAMGEVSWPEARRVIAREALAGAVNGAIVGSVAALIAFLFHAPLVLALVLGAALVVNLFVAGLFGAAVPFMLKRMKIDPATASSIFVTTATDVFGFLVFLGLGSWLLL